MPAIPVYTNSPINAGKPSGVTPQTARPEDVPASGAVATATSTAPYPYPAAQPGAVPPMPQPTTALESLSNSSAQPTPTQSIQHAGPPAPQPGAVPLPPTNSRSPMPPPPKAGETLTQAPAATTTMPLPPQMSYNPPVASYPMQGGSSTVTDSSSYHPNPTVLSNQPDHYAHPPGYQQNTYAADFSSNQRAAQNASMAENSQVFTSSGEDDGVWDTAKKWATAAGDRLAAAENEVWKKINKD